MKLLVLTIAILCIHAVLSKEDEASKDIKGIKVGVAAEHENKVSSSMDKKPGFTSRPGGQGEGGKLGAKVQGEKNKEHESRGEGESGVDGKGHVSVGGQGGKGQGDSAGVSSGKPKADIDVSFSYSDSEEDLKF